MLNRSHPCCLALASFVIFCAVQWFPMAFASEKGFRAGAYAQDITPDQFPISVNGGMQDRLAHGVHDRLHARCLVLDDGQTKLAFAVCDSCMIPREIMDEAKRLASEQTGIPVTNMLISATHTHTAPTVAGAFQSEANVQYAKALPKLIAKGITEAHARLQPARIGWAVGKDPTQVFNRRWKMEPGTISPDPFGRNTDRVKMNPGYQAKGLIEPAGPIDPDVSILAVQTRDGKPLALLANYSLHYVGGVSPLSADYFGAFADRIAQLLEAPKEFVGIMSNGTSGDVNNINFAGPPPARQREFEQCKIVANSVAQAALEAYRRIEFKDHVPLAVAERDITLGVRRPTAEEVAQAKEILAQAKGPVLQTLPEVYARETVLLAEYPPSVPVKLQAMRVGDLGIAAIPCEVFAEIGLELKKRSPLQPMFTISLANGYNGYLPTPEQHKLGGYETWRARSSYLEVDASTKITATILELLNEVAMKGRN
ncbi:MAG: neutral/alkaline non-lysosomal ceramidase N-terminal domain-containing protein [Gemmatales bacterium]|nr:neutral/alkaline non-lysosomal ceramidase N-terminal domain-containing protein [Gemmatales bacterium]MDW8387835.1 neutral/alkaline non-lysosomal ceramidase N-terminal domain-containing protein [Gemmatales bacterium]